MFALPQIREHLQVLLRSIIVVEQAGLKASLRGKTTGRRKASPSLLPIADTPAPPDITDDDAPPASRRAGFVAIPLDGRWRAMKALIVVALIAVLLAAVPCFAQSQGSAGTGKSWVVIPLQHISPELVAQLFGGVVIYDLTGQAGGMAPGGGMSPYGASGFGASGARGGLYNNGGYGVGGGGYNNGGYGARRTPYGNGYYGGGIGYGGGGY
jgi:hypothetical protein